MSIFIGVDVGGTFTDLYAVDTSSRRVYTYKRPSTPSDPSAAILSGVHELLERYSLPLSAVAHFAHGTTVATNTLLQRNGAVVALITTRGFRDLLEIGRQTRPENYDMHLDFPPPVVSRPRRFEVEERMAADGTVVKALTDDAIDQVIKSVARSGAQAVAVCLLFGYLNPEHEQRIGEAIRQRLPDMHLSLSSEVQPEFREYERFSTTSLNAYLQPRLADYLHNLESAVRRDFPEVEVAISQSSGGLMSVRQAHQFPVRTALSGPAAGVVGALGVARAAERPNVITFDMGGTSADVAMIRDFQSGESYERRIGGLPMRLPMIDINTVGAGGGSVAWFDRDGLLKVGPRSAGADPGPACYGRKGVEATVTDANLVLRRLSEGGLLGGTMGLDRELAVMAVGKIASTLGCSLERAALGIVEIVVSNMVRAIRAVSVERGHDPRECSLLAFGGAGPLHARDIAVSLRMPEIIVPPTPGILCAAGLLSSELCEGFVITARLPVSTDARQSMVGALAELAKRGDKWFERERVPRESRRCRVTFDLRYVGQNFELPIALKPVAGKLLPEIPSADALCRLFWAAHERSYGHFSADDPIELVNIRLSASQSADPLPVPRIPEGSGASPIPTGYREVWFDASGPVRVPLFDRSVLQSGQHIAGPAIVDQMDSTTLLFPGDALTVHASGNLLIRISS